MSGGRRRGSTTTNPAARSSTSGSCSAASSWRPFLFCGCLRLRLRGRTATVAATAAVISLLFCAVAYRLLRFVSGCGDGGDGGRRTTFRLSFSSSEKVPSPVVASSVSSGNATTAAASSTTKDAADTAGYGATTTAAAFSLPPPDRVLQRYASMHSNDALLKEEHERQHRQHRQSHRACYSIGYYSCPLQAGNRLHHFLNALAWSVVLNRTLLAQYYTREACLHAGKGVRRRRVRGRRVRRR